MGAVKSFSGGIVLKKIVYFISILTVSIMFYSCDTDSSHFSYDYDYNIIIPDENNTVTDEESDDDPEIEEEVWSVTLTFDGPINDSSVTDPKRGSGVVVLTDEEGNETRIGAYAWAVRTYQTVIGDESIPQIQIFWSDQNDNGEIIEYYVLNLEGTTVQFKNEALFVSRDAFYKVKAVRTGNQFSLPCILESPTDGKITILSHDIRVGSDITISGVANMEDANDTSTSCQDYSSDN